MKIKIFGSGIKDNYLMSQAPRILDGFRLLGHEIIESETADIIYCNDPGFFCEAIDYKGIFGGKLVLNVLDRPWHCKEINEWDTKIRRQLGNADIVTSISEYTKLQIREHLGIDSHVIYQPIKDLNITNAKKINDFLIIGRNQDPNKRAYLFEEIFFTEKHKDKTFAAVGEPLPRFGLGFLGKLTDEELNEIYNMSKIVFCLSKNEGLCLPMIEAISLGIPCIVCNDMTTAKEFAHSDFLVQPNSVDIFDKAQNILDNYDYYRGIAMEIGEGYIKKFNKIQIAKNIISLI
jgi:hypothetical protein